LVREIDLELADGRTLHAYDTGPADGFAICWQHGTPGLGVPPEPLFAAARRLGIRWVSHDRPGYGGSTRRPGRTIASVAGDIAAVADAFGVERFAVLGASGGAPHCLAAGALLPDRVVAVVSIAGLAPYDADGLDWFAGMGPSGEAELRTATAGRAALTAHLTTAEFDPDIFTPADHEALAGAWGWLGRLAAQAMADGVDAMADDDLAYVTPWGFDPTRVMAPLLLMHGADDRMVPCTHSEWLADHCPGAELRISRGDGHVSVLRHCEQAMEWLRERA
jgi:pimeloyl-ACP methyl ester carboxylesterase